MPLEFCTNWIYCTYKKKSYRRNKLKDFLVQGEKEKLRQCARKLGRRIGKNGETEAKGIEYFRKPRVIGWIKCCERASKSKNELWIVTWCNSKVIGCPGERNFSGTHNASFRGTWRGYWIERRDTSILFPKVRLLVSMLRWTLKIQIILEIPTYSKEIHTNKLLHFKCYILLAKWN